MFQVNIFVVFKNKYPSEIWVWKQTMKKFTEKFGFHKKCVVYFLQFCKFRDDKMKAGFMSIEDATQKS